MGRSFHRGEEEYGLLDSIIEHAKVTLSETGIEISVAVKHADVDSHEIA